MYTKYLKKIASQNVYKTLGDRSKFKVKVNGELFQITNSRGKSYDIDEDLFNIVLKRYQELDIELKFKTNQYTDPIWAKCPNRVACAYIAAIIRQIK
jgi:hypothetical protein